MKKQLSIALLLCLICIIIAGCGENPEEKETPFDLDLTQMSGTMAHAAVFDMMDAPENYLGKTVKAGGVYTGYYVDTTNRYYHYVVIESAVACCPQGMEFAWSDEHGAPRDYPEENAKIEVTGVFSDYVESGKTRHYLAVESITEAN